MTEERVERGFGEEIVIKKDGEYIGCDPVENVELQNCRRMANVKPPAQLYFLFKRKNKISFANDIVPILIRVYGDEPLRSPNCIQKDIEDLLVELWLEFGKKWIAVPKFKPGYKNTTVIDIVYKKIEM